MMLKVFRNVVLLVIALSVPALAIIPENGYTTNPEAYYLAPDAGGELTNGVVATDPYDEDWSLYAVGGSSLEVVCDFNDIVDFSTVNVQYMNMGIWGNQPPQSIDVSFSDDGQTYSEPISFAGFDATDSTACTAYLDVLGSSGRFVKTVLYPGDQGWLRLSELTFEQPGQSYYVANPAAHYIAPDLGNMLCDGIVGTDDPYDASYVRYYPGEGVDQEFVFAFNEYKNLRQVGFNYSVVDAWGVEPPAKVEISYSSDGNVYSTPAEFSGFSAVGGSRSAFCDVQAADCKYVKIKFTPGANFWLHLSEIFFIDNDRVTYTSQPESHYLSPDKAYLMTDGKIATVDPYCADWVKFYPGEGQVQSFILDLGDKKVAEVGVNYGVVSAWSVEAPQQISVSASNDGQTFTEPVVATGFDNTDGSHNACVGVLSLDGRYLKVDITPGASAWLHMSEFVFVEQGETVYSLNPAPHSSSTGTVETLFNGVLASPDPYDQDIVKFYLPEQSEEITVNFNEIKTLQYVGLHYGVVSIWTVEAPDIEITTSLDGQTYSQPIVLKNNDNTDGAHTAYASLADVQCRFLKIKATPGASGWMHLSEVLIGDQSRLVTYDIADETPVSDWNIDNSGIDLTNGIEAFWDIYDSEWVAWFPEDTSSPAYAIIKFDLGSQVAVDSLAMTYLNDPGNSAYAPMNMEVSFSNDANDLYFSTPVTYEGFESSIDGICVAEFDLGSQQARYVKVKINCADNDAAKSFYLGEFAFNDFAGDVDGDLDVDAQDITALASEWTTDVATGVYEENMLQDFEGYANDDDLANDWAYYDNSNSPSMANLITDAQEAYSGSKALRWTYFCDAPETNWTETIYNLANPVNLAEYDRVTLWINRHVGNSEESAFYLKFFNGGTGLEDVAGEAWCPGSTSGNAGEWTKWEIDLHDLIYLPATKENGYDSLDDITNATAIMIGTVEKDGGMGVIDIDDIKLVKVPSCEEFPQCDVNKDCRVDLDDYSWIAQDWLKGVINDD